MLQIILQAVRPAAGTAQVANQKCDFFCDDGRRGGLGLWTIVRNSVQTSLSKGELLQMRKNNNLE